MMKNTLIRLLISIIIAAAFIWWFKNQLQTNALGKVLKKEYREQFNKQQEKGEDAPEE